MCILCVDKLDLVERISVTSVVERDVLDMDVCRRRSAFTVVCVYVCV